MNNLKKKESGVLFDATNVLFHMGIYGLFVAGD